MRLKSLVIVLVLVGCLALAGLAFPYSGEDIAISKPTQETQNSVVSFSGQLQEKIPMVILVSSSSGALENVSVYLDREYRGRTSSDGILILEDIEGTHDLTLKDSGFEENRKINLTKQENTFKYNVKRNLTLQVNVSQIYRSTPIANASVEVDGTLQGFTDSSGQIKIDLIEGVHDVKASYNGFSEERRVNLNSNKDLNIEMVYVPQKTSVSLW